MTLHRKTLGFIRNDLQGVRATVATIQNGIAAALRSPSFLEAARRVPLLPGGIVRYVRSMRYQPDPPGVEAVQTPIATMQRRAGDCEDLTALLCALALANGLKCRLAVIADTTPGIFTHLYPEVWLPTARDWLPIETIRDWPEGREAPHVEKITFPPLPTRASRRWLASGVQRADLGRFRAPLQLEVIE